MFRAVRIFILCAVLLVTTVRQTSLAHDGTTDCDRKDEQAAICRCGIDDDRTSGCGTFRFLSTAKTQTMKRKAARFH